MLFENDEINDELDHHVMHVLKIGLTHCGIRSVPTHTEDGIPIRKLYVSNLPPKTTRMELFGVFAHYGFIKSCWVRLVDNGASKCPAYAFVTYCDPAHAHKALQAPPCEKTLRGRILKIYPADSWHQPLEDSDGKVHWKTHGECASQILNTSGRNFDIEQDLDDPKNENDEASNSKQSSRTDDTTDAASSPGYNILEILNRDCLTHILNYVPVRDLIISERVSKDWRNLVQEHMQGYRTFKTSWWQHRHVTLTTAVLRRILARVGTGLTRLYIDHRWSALNDRTAHTVGKFCPNLEDLVIVGMYTKNWNPLAYGCKELKSLSFISCNKLTDSSLTQLMKSDSTIENLTVTSNTHVTGLFLTGSNPRNLKSLAFYDCYSIQGTVLSTAIDMLPNLTSLKLDVCPLTLWKMIPIILNKLPKLEELSLSDYTLTENKILFCVESFIQSIGNLKELKKLNLSKNIFITNAVLKQVATTCSKLQHLNVSSCNSRKNVSLIGVSDEGISAVCRACPQLSHLDVSYLAALTDSGLTAAAQSPQLTHLTSRGNPALSDQPFSACIAACHYLEEVDMCGCDSVSEEVVHAANEALQLHPRAMRLWLASTAVITTDNLSHHPLLRLNLDVDNCEPHLRPDFVERMFDDSSDDSFDLYEHENFDDFLRSDDDDIYLEDDLDNYEDMQDLYDMGYIPDFI